MIDQYLIDDFLRSLQNQKPNYQFFSSVNATGKGPVPPKNGGIISTLFGNFFKKGHSVADFFKVLAGHTACFSMVDAGMNT